MISDSKKINQPNYPIFLDKNPFFHIDTQNIIRTLLESDEIEYSTMQYLKKLELQSKKNSTIAQFTPLKIKQIRELNQSEQTTIQFCRSEIGLFLALSELSNQKNFDGVLFPFSNVIKKFRLNKNMFTEFKSIGHGHVLKGSTIRNTLKNAEKKFEELETPIDQRLTILDIYTEANNYNPLLLRNFAQTPKTNLILNTINKTNGEHLDHFTIFKC